MANFLINYAYFCFLSFGNRILFKNFLSLAIFQVLQPRLPAPPTQSPPCPKPLLHLLLLYKLAGVDGPDRSRSSPDDADLVKLVYFLFTLFSDLNKITSWRVLNIKVKAPERHFYGVRASFKQFKLPQFTFMMERVHHCELSLPTLSSPRSPPSCLPSLTHQCPARGDCQYIQRTFTGNLSS